MREGYLVLSPDIYEGKVATEIPDAERMMKAVDQDAARKKIDEEVLKGAGKDVTTHVYPGAKHWFDEPSRPEYDPAASALAWGRTLSFLRKHLV